MSTTWCPECGPHVEVYVHGCCVTCGANAVGPGADAAAKALADLELHNAILIVHGGHRDCTKHGAHVVVTYPRAGNCPLCVAEVEIAAQAARALVTEDEIFIRTEIHFSWPDRLRVLFRGRAHVETEIPVEFPGSGTLVVREAVSRTWCPRVFPRRSSPMSQLAPDELKNEEVTP